MDKIDLSTEAEGSHLDPAELAEFLFLYRGIITGLTRIIPDSQCRDFREPNEREISKSREALRGLRPRELNLLFESSMHEDSVQIDRISRQSPLEIVFSGCAFLLVLGVIFSGGSVSISKGSLRASLPSLGSGIKSLKEALGLGKTLDAGFGIRPRIIKLSKAEFAELMRQDPESRNKGGFQHFLVGLQMRVNRKTRQLELSESDLDRIYRHKANPNKGGWQSRFKKIFGHHFPK